MKGKTLRLILGDQLNSEHSWFKKIDPNVTYCIFEMKQETNYVRHHIQKIAGFFLAMRILASQLIEAGHEVRYYQLDDPDNTHDLKSNLNGLIAEQGFDRFEYQLPDEYRLDEQLRQFCSSCSIETKTFDTEHFLTTRLELSQFFEGKKQFLMESFYRNMRKKHNILMDGKEPLGGKWNFDKENRKPIPRDLDIPEPILFKKDVSEILNVLKEQDVSTIGNIDPANFVWPTSRKESLKILDYFLEKLLPHFGDFQDAMTMESWSLYHSRLSFSLNTKMISPLEVVRKVITHWGKNQETISLSQVEGFVRQIIGWREYMRGIYWAKMPDYKKLNFFGHKKELPPYFWNGQTKMKCVSHAVSQSLDYAYAHHIQRLMITGSFSLLAGIDPDEVDMWYLGIYMDAIEWVEITNTRGMSQFADGGIVGTKPYVSSANYINKMSHYCKSCHYNPKIRTGPEACPFNSLYWAFHDRHRDKLEKNPRIGMVYRTWDKMGSEKKTALLEQASLYLENLENL